MDADVSTPVPRPAPRLHHRAQDRVAALIGLAPEQRRRRLAELMRPRAGDAAGYWLQLSISVIIATLGLAQGSTAVVIGAMLIAPLMQPIVELGFGLALGSPLLVFRSSARFVGGLLLTLAASAAITHALPFHEATPELIARTSPTMLDLFVAAACALAAVYTTVHASGETASAAAGTAIGISLVPPLCTAGWGLGTGSIEVARGAALLFTANFTAIVVLTSVSALLVGFGQLDVSSLEAGEMDADRDGTAQRAARVSSRLFHGRLAIVLRIALPLALLAAIYVPLRAALHEVAWQAGAREDVRAALEPYGDRVVRQSLEIRRGRIHLRLIAIGDRASNEDALAAMRADIKERTGTEPAIEAIYVPDSEALAVFARSLPAVEPAAPPAPPPPRPPGPRFATVMADSVAAHWPTSGGELLATRVTVGPTLGVELVHLGPDLGPAARELLASALADAAGLPVVVDEQALPAEPSVGPADPAAQPAWLAHVVTALAAAPADLAACIEAPAPPPPPRRGRALPDPQRELVLATVTAAPGRGPRTLTLTDRWALRFTRDGCAPPAAAPPDPESRAD